MKFEPYGLVYLQYHAIAFLVVSFICLIRLIYNKVKKKNNFKSIVFEFSILLCFLLLGLTIGILTGSSKEPNTHMVISAILTFIGALASYIFAKTDSSNENKKYVLIIIGALAISIICGFDVAIQHRIVYEDDNKKFDVYHKEQFEFFKAKLESEREGLNFSDSFYLYKNKIDTFGPIIE